MQSNISPSTQQLLTELLQSGEFQDYDEAIAFLASKTLERSPLPKLPEHIDVSELIREQGVPPVTDFRSLKGDFYPPEETSEEFLQAIDDRSRLDAPTAG